MTEPTATAGVRWVTLKDAQKILEMNDEQMERAMNDTAFPQVAEIVDEFLIQLDALEQFIIEKENHDDTPPQPKRSSQSY